MENSWDFFLDTLSNGLNNMSVTSYAGRKISTNEGFDRWINETQRIRSDGSYVYLVGNGASASMASHFATDLSKNGGLRTHTFTDLSLITAIGNDICFDQVFSEPLRWYMKEGEMLVAISSSGNSKNIVNAVDVARKKNSFIVTLSGFNESNAINNAGDINFYIPVTSYGHAETGHAAVLHHWMNLVERTLKL